MKKTIEQFYCDVCGKEADVQNISYPVIFHTEQCEGRPVKAYVDYNDIDMCKECLAKALVVHGWGGQGNNRYVIRTTADKQ